MRSAQLNLTHFKARICVMREAELHLIGIKVHPRGNRELNIRRVRPVHRHNLHGQDLPAGSDLDRQDGLLWP